jgi:hypothetical protein
VKLTGAGITVNLPSGWEGSIAPSETLPDGAVRHSVTHVANFALPAQRGDYGGGAVEVMHPGDVLIILLEFDQASISQPLFARKGLPAPLRASDFSRETLQRSIVGQGGCQYFFQQTGRAFCLYIVVGSHLDRVDVLPVVNQILGSIEIAP